MKQLLMIILALIFTAHLHSSAAPASEEQSFEQSFHTHVEQWIDSLAMNEGFEAWQTATWESYPLGPGTHGWIILINNEDHKQEIGYLVIHATPEMKLVLSEYGLGAFPLFGSTIYERITTLQEPKLDPDTVERLYYDAFHAVWKLSGADYVSYYDGVTGEAYELTTPILNKMNKLMQTYQHTDKLTTISAIQRYDVFDPYELLNWLQGEGIQIDSFQQLTQALNKQPQQITFTASLFDDMIRTPFAITGYHIWDQGKEHDIFVSLDQYSTRFIPFNLLQQHGRYYDKALPQLGLLSPSLP